jgi:hypothetical protein
VTRRACSGFGECGGLDAQLEVDVADPRGHPIGDVAAAVAAAALGPQGGGGRDQHRDGVQVGGLDRGGGELDAGSRGHLSELLEQSSEVVGGAEHPGLGGHRVGGCRARGGIDERRCLDLVGESRTGRGDRQVTHQPLP